MKTLFEVRFGTKKGHGRNHARLSIILSTKTNSKLGKNRLLTKKNASD
jgi:hypothetical protein